MHARHTLFHCVSIGVLFSFFIYFLEPVKQKGSLIWSVWSVADFFPGYMMILNVKIPEITC